MKVNVSKSDHLERALKLFKRNCSAAGILKDYRSKSCFEKPTTVNRKAKKQRFKNLKKIQAIRAQQ